MIFHIGYLLKSCVCVQFLFFLFYLKAFSVSIAAEGRLRELEEERQRLDKELQKARDRIFYVEHTMTQHDTPKVIELIIIVLILCFI